MFSSRYYDLIEKHGNLKPLVDIEIRAPYLTQVRLVYNEINYDKEIDVRQTVQQFKKYLHEIFHLPLNRLRVFHVDDMAFQMGLCGPEELKYPQRFLHTYARIIRFSQTTIKPFFFSYQFRYNIHDGDQFHIDLKPDQIKSHRASTSNRFFNLVVFCFLSIFDF